MAFIQYFLYLNNKKIDVTHILILIYTKNRSGKTYFLLYYTIIMPHVKYWTDNDDRQMTKGGYRVNDTGKLINVHMVYIDG